MRCVCYLIIFNVYFKNKNVITFFHGDAFSTNPRKYLPVLLFSMDAWVTLFFQSKYFCDFIRCFCFVFCSHLAIGYVGNCDKCCLIVSGRSNVVQDVFYNENCNIKNILKNILNWTISNQNSTEKPWNGHVPTHPSENF